MVDDEDVLLRGLGVWLVDHFGDGVGSSLGHVG